MEQEPTDQSRRPPKRSSEPSRAFYPRRRALVACEVCRRKKSKCDNTRPTCGSCRDLLVDCVYREARSDHSTYDLASLEILEQIGRVAELVETQNAQFAGLLPLLAARTSSSPLPLNPLANEAGYAPLYSTPLTLQSPHDVPHRYEPGDEAALLAESLEFAETSTVKCEDLLEWPIFEGKFQRSETETLIFNPDLEHEDQYDQSVSIEGNLTRRSGHRRGVREEDALSLVQRFLANVHIKNPILDAEDIKKMAKDIMEYGFKWDASSCLVLIASALGTVSSPYTADNVPDALAQGNNVCDSVDDVADYSTAESYYVASQKRIGLLKSSILAAQCCFLSGVYEMYSLRPIRAWTSFNRACVILQIYLKTKTRNPDPSAERLERRLYWSCLKSECEITMEIRLPPSGLAKANYPDVFPTPPSGSPRPFENLGGSIANAHFGMSPTTLSSELEKSWGYYLSDIAVRRIANRLVNTFYQNNTQSWLSMPIEQMIRVAEELELQLTQWYNHVPKLVTTPDPSSASPESEELRSLIDFRLLEFRELICRPFVYRAIHQAELSAERHVIDPYVQRCLEACVQNTLRGSRRHRHHGTWYQNRRIFAESLTVLAAVKSRRVIVPSNWRDAIRSTIRGLRFWEREAPDLQRARIILQTMVDDIDREWNPM